MSSKADRAADMSLELSDLARTNLIQSDWAQRAEKAAQIGAILDNIYPSVEPTLDHTDAFTLLVATLLSAQCTDKKVNAVTPLLFAKAGTPQAMAALGEAEILSIIKSLGLAPTKSRHLVALSQKIVDNFQGQVPRTFPELESLPGVGHKTASVVMALSFGVPAFPVDTHIRRLAQRWGLSNSDNVKTIEADLKQLFPPESWYRRHLQLILFGREYCPARHTHPENCPICKVIRNA